MISDIALDALIDTLKVIPFLFLTYLLIEFLEHHGEGKAVSLVHRAGKWGPVIGSAVGVIPQCGFSAAMSNLYAGGVITRGTLIAVFLSTSDEMLPILISSSAPVSLILKILLVKFAAGMIAGLVIDITERKLHREDGEHLHDLCEQEGCHCEDGILKSALLHTLKISAFLLLTSFVVAIVVGMVGVDRLGSLVLNQPVAGELISGLIGLIPNCAASVVITQVYLAGGMSAGAMLSGLLTGSGVGLLVLFRMNRKKWKDNLLTLALLYCCGVVLGLLAGLTGWIA